MPNIPGGGTGGAGGGTGISPDDQAKLDNCPANVTAELATKVDTTLTLTATAPLSGGGALSTDRAFAVNVATNSTSGIITGSDYSRLQSIQAYGEVHLVDLDGGNSSLTLTNMASTVAYSPAGTYKGSDLTGVNTVNLRFDMTNASTNANSRIGLIFSPNTVAPFTWYMADNSAAPASGNAAPADNAAYCMTAINVGAKSYKVSTTVPPVINGACTIGFIRWGGTGSGNDSPVLNNIRVTTPGSAIPGVGSFNGRSGTVSPASNDYTQNMVADENSFAFDAKVAMRAIERQNVLIASRRGKSPQNFIRRLTNLKLTDSSNFGGTALTADSVPDGSSGTDDLAHLKTIREYLRTNYNNQEVELTLPQDRCVKLSKVCNWDIQNVITNFVGRGPMNNVFANVYTGGRAGFANGFLNYGGTTNSVLYLHNMWRLATGVDGTANMKEYDHAFIATNAGDYAAVQVGDWLMFLSAYYYDNGGTYPWAPQRRWTARVVSKDDGTNTIYLDRRFPFDFIGTTNGTINSGAYIYKRSSGTAITGNVFGIFSEMVPEPAIQAADTSATNTMFHARVNLFNLGLYSKTGFPIQGGMMLDSVWDTVHAESDDYFIYGNAMQQCYLRNLSCRNISGLMELGVGSHHNVFEDIVWSYRETPITAENSQGWILRCGEGSHDNLVRRVKLLGRNKTSASSPGGGPAIVQAYNSSAYRVEELFCEVGFSSQSWYAFWTDAKSLSYAGRNNCLHDAYFKYYGAAPGGLLHLGGHGGEIKRVKVVGNTSTNYSAPTIVASANDCQIEDVVVTPLGTSKLTVASGCNRTQIHRWEGGVTNSGTGTVQMNVGAEGSGVAQLGNFFAGL